jgi:hypothetical protein
MTPRERLVKYEWVLNNYLKGQGVMVSIPEAQELDDIYHEIWGIRNNLGCNTCKATMLENLAKWFFNVA